MSLLYKDEHITCIHYQKEDPLIKICSHKKDEQTRIRTKKNSIILFLKKGKISISYKGSKDTSITEMQAILLPLYSDFNLNFAEDSNYMTFAFSSQVVLCESFSISQLYPHSYKEKNSGLTPLKINKQLENYLNLLEQYIGDGINCIRLYNLKKQELFYVLRAYFPKEKLAEFLYPIFNKEDIAFKMTILENCLKTKTIQELAEVANYSTSGFIKKFERCFNDSPHRWINQYKSDKILQEINNGNKSIKDICNEYKFSSMPYFIEFCKKQYGLTPGKIKKHIYPRKINK